MVVAYFWTTLYDEYRFHPADSVNGHEWQFFCQRCLPFYSLCGKRHFGFGILPHPSCSRIGTTRDPRPSIWHTPFGGICPVVRLRAYISFQHIRSKLTWQRHSHGQVIYNELRVPPSAASDVVGLTGAPATCMIYYAMRAGWLKKVSDCRISYKLAYLMPMKVEFLSNWNVLRNIYCYQLVLNILRAT